MKINFRSNPISGLHMLALALVCTTISLTAQTTSPGKTRFAVLGGVNFQNLNGQDRKGVKLENKMIAAYHLGLNVMIPVATDFYFQPGLLFSVKGGKQQNDSFGNTVKIGYIEVPLNFVYSATLGSGKFILGFGPYLAYGITGSHTSKSDVKSDLIFSNTSNSGNPDNMSTLKRFDAGGNIFAGYELKGGLFFQLNTQLGMLKINPEYSNFSDDKTELKNTGFGVSLGFRF
jgi:Outer membrane protein beta-barrel domain